MHAKEQEGEKRKRITMILLLMNSNFIIIYHKI